MIVRRLTLREKSIISFILLLASAGHTRTWYVKPDQTGDAPTIQAAIDSTTTGDTVLVAPGTYTEAWISISKSIHLISETGAQNTQIYSPPTAESSVLTLDGLSSNSSVIGFNLAGANQWMGYGGGIDIRGSSTLIKDNIIRWNTTQFGGGIACWNGGVPIIRKNVIYENIGLGDAIYVWDSAAVIDSNTIAYNYDPDGWGPIYIDSTLPVTISNNIIAFNQAYENGGIYCHSSPENIVCECNLVYENIPANYSGELSDQTGINGNFSLDPQFCAVDPTSTGNFLLQSDSPCLPGNHPDGCDCGLIGALPEGCGPTSILDEVPSATVLYQNFPNPFNPVTTIRYYISEKARVVLHVYDISGRLVARLAEGQKEKGIHLVDWRGLDESSNPLASGIYFYQLRAGNEKISRKMVLLR